MFTITLIIPPFLSMLASNPSMFLLSNDDDSGPLTNRKPNWLYLIQLAKGMRNEGSSI